MDGITKSECRGVGVEGQGKREDALEIPSLGTSPKLEADNVT